MIHNFISFIELPDMTSSVVPLPFKKSDTMNMLLVLVWSLTYRKSNKILSIEKAKIYLTQELSKFYQAEQPNI